MDCRYCKGPNAIHYLGGGIWVCFTCFLRHFR
jgi:ribosomal protein L37AE/L43A